jgi:hypothetical protein
MADEGQEQEPRYWFQIPEPESDGSCRHWMNPAWCAICASGAVDTAPPIESSQDEVEQPLR